MRNLSFNQVELLIGIVSYKILHQKLLFTLSYPLLRILLHHLLNVPEIFKTLSVGRTLQAINDFKDMSAFVNSTDKNNSDLQISVYVPKTSFEFRLSFFNSVFFSFFWGGGNGKKEDFGFLWFILI